MTNLGTAYVRIKVDDGQLKPGLYKAEMVTEKATKSMTRNFDRVRSSATALKTVLGLIGGAAILYGLKRTGDAFLQAATSAEGYQIRLKTLLGSQEEGNRLFKEMATYAATVPFTYDKIMGSATALAGVMDGGVKEIQRWIPMIGDLAAVSGMTFEETTGQIIRMYSAGAASADMFRERGILAMLGFEAGVSYSAEETRKQMFEAWNAIDSKFKGVTGDLGKSWSGMISMFSDHWMQFRQTMMDAGPFDMLKEGASELLEVLNELKEDGTLDEWAWGMADGFIGAIQFMIQAVGVLDKAIAGTHFLFLKMKKSWGTSFAIWVNETQRNQLLNKYGENDHPSMGPRTPEREKDLKTLEQLNYNLEYYNGNLAAGEKLIADYIERQREVDALYKRINDRLEYYQQRARNAGKHTNELSKAFKDMGLEGLSSLFSDLDKSAKEALETVSKWERIDFNLGMAPVSESGNLFDMSGFSMAQEEAADETIELWENTRNVLQNSLADSLVTVFKGEFEDIGDLFSQLIDNLLSAWGSMVSQMIMEGKALSGMTMSQSIGTMGMAGAVLGIGSYMMSESQKPGATELFWEQYNENLRKAEEQTKSLSDTIASFELSDLDYALYRVNQKYKEQIELANAVGNTLEDVGRAMYLELQAASTQAMSGHTRLIDQATGWLQDKEREDWGVDEYLAEFESIDESLQGLDRSAGDYYEKSLDLFQDQFDILMSIDRLMDEQVSLTQRQIDEIDAQVGSIDDMLYRLSPAGDLTAAQSMAGFQGRFDELLDGQDVAGLLNFIPKYLDFASSYGHQSGQDTIDYISGVLMDLKDGLTEEQDALTKALGDLRDKVEGNTTATGVNTSSLASNTSALISSIGALVDNLEGDRTDALRDAWVAGSPSALGYDMPDPASLWIPGSPSHPDYSAQAGDYEGQLLGNNFTDFRDWANLMLPWLMTAPEGIGLDLDSIGTFTDWLKDLPTFEKLDTDRDGIIGPNDMDTAWSLWLSRMPELKMYGRGGLTSGLSLAGERGAEWVVPTYEPERSKFLSDVGADPDKIGRAVAKYLAPLLNNKQTIMADGRVLAQVVNKQVGASPNEFKNIGVR